MSLATALPTTGRTGQAGDSATGQTRRGTGDLRRLAHILTYEYGGRVGIHERDT